MHGRNVGTALRKTLERPMKARQRRICVGKLPMSMSTFEALDEPSRVKRVAGVFAMVTGAPDLEPSGGDGSAPSLSTSSAETGCMFALRSAPAWLPFGMPVDLAAVI